MSNTKNILNYSIGMILGIIGSVMWQYDKFLYYGVFCVQAVILYILINYSSTYSVHKSPTSNHSKKVR